MICMERIKCAICSSEDFSVVLTTGDYRFHMTEEKFNIVQCLQCGLMYVNPRPNLDELPKYYEKKYYSYRPSRIEKVYCNFLDYIKIRRLNKCTVKGKILDVGCETGDFLFKMKEKGWEVYGVDISEDACKLAREKLKIDVYNCELEQCSFPAGFFDIVTLWHSLEHVPNPNQILKEINRILKTDGILVLEVPNIANPVFKLTKECYFALDVPRHLYHFSPETLEAILAKNGFTIKDKNFPVSSFPFSLFKSVSNMLRYRLNINSHLISLLLISLLSPILTILTVVFRFASLITESGETMRFYCVKQEAKKT